MLTWNASCLSYHYLREINNSNMRIDVALSHSSMNDRNKKNKEIEGDSSGSDKIKSERREKREIGVMVLFGFVNIKFVNFWLYEYIQIVLHKTLACSQFGMLFQFSNSPSIKLR